MTILITGCSSGLGQAAARQLSSAGHVVVATARRASDVRRLARELAGPSVHVMRLDISDSCSVDEMVTECRSRLGPIDVLINNAGVEVVGPMEATTDDDLAWQWETNVAGTFRMTRAVLPEMRRRRSGRIIFVSSLMGRAGRPFGSAYTASKFAVEGMAEALRWEMRPFGVAVSVVRPGRFASALGRNQRRSGGVAPDDPYGPYAAEYARALSRLEPPGYSPDAAMMGAAIVGLVDDSDPPMAISVGADTEATLGAGHDIAYERHEREMSAALGLTWGGQHD